MIWNRSEPKARRGYHHGNLREALLDAALGLMAEKGVAGFTFADLARAAHVSPAAPYRHYRDRDDLIADLARQGFELFGAALLAAWENGRPDPKAALMRLGRAYLAFARKNPAYYAAMFEATLSAGLSPELAEVSNAAFEVLRMACEAVAATFRTPNRPPARMMALHIWSLSHGIATLFARPSPTSRTLPMAPDELLEAGVLVYLDGLGAGIPSSTQS
jgi:AcrR family transcriptional regulator